MSTIIDKFKQKLSDSLYDEFPYWKIKYIETKSDIDESKESKLLIPLRDNCIAIRVQYYYLGVSMCSDLEIELDRIEDIDYSDMYLKFIMNKLYSITEKQEISVKKNIYNKSLE